VINLVYLSKNTTGGWVTFTYHLFKCLEQAGHKPRLFKCGNRDERGFRPFGYGIDYRNMTLSSMVEMAASQPTIIVAAAKQLAEEAKQLLGAGAHIVIHDPTEVTTYLRPEDIKSSPWVIRKANAERLPGSTFIRHPYMPFPVDRSKKKLSAISISRIDFDKNTDILLDANRLGADIDIRGFENRLYTKFKLVPKYPEWVQSVVHYPRDKPNTAVELLKSHAFMTDMSLIKGDGGGTQYTTLEAWNAGTIPVIHSEWIRLKDDMKPGFNCLTAGSGEELASVLTQARRKASAEMRELLVAAGSASLRFHSPGKIVPQIMKWLGITV
jgi:hypothetical protein